MPTYTIETARGRKLKIESDSPEAATRLADTWDLEDHASSEATRMGLNPDVALRQMRQESGSRSDAVSPKGARGPMQLMPNTARELGVNADDPYANITGGLTYYKKQLDANGGDERKALAAYNAGPGAVARAGGVPNYPETVNYVNAIMGPDGAPVARPKPPPLPGQPGAVPVPQMGPGVTMERVVPPAPALRADQGLGFMKGLTQVGDRAAQGLEYLAEKVGVADEINALNQSLGLPSTQQAMDSRAQYLAAQQAKGVRPGKIGEFAGNVAGTAFVPGGPLVQGAVGGALTGNATDLRGVAGEAALGGIIGRGTALASDAVQLGARKVLSKVPQIMDLPALQKASDDAWDAVDASGFRFAKTSIQKTAKDIAQLVDDAGPELYAESAKIARRVADLAKRGQLSVAQANRLRSQIGEKLLQPGSTEASLGALIKGKIDDLIDSANDPTIARARDLYTRLSKYKTVTKELESADLRTSAAYSGANADNTIRQRMRPLTDPTSGKRINNATPDEKAATRKVVRGTFGQNRAREVGALLDPRKLGGKLFASAVGGSSLLNPANLIALGGLPVGIVATAIANSASKKNVDDLIRLIAAGGSKQALARVPTASSYTAERAVRAARPALVAASVPALAAAREPNRKDGKRPNSR